MKNPHHTPSADEQIVQLVSLILNDDDNWLDHVRKICTLRLSTKNPENEIFLIFRYIDSEFDEYIIHQNKKLINENYLNNMIIRKNNFYSEIKTDLYEACRLVAESLSHKNQQ